MLTLIYFIFVVVLASTDATILYKVHFHHDVHQLGVRSDMALSLLPVQLSVNIYMGNIIYLRCPSTTYLINTLYLTFHVDSNLTITFILAPND